MSLRGVGIHKTPPDVQFPSGAAEPEVPKKQTLLIVWAPGSRGEAAQSEFLWKVTNLSSS